MLSAPRSSRPWRAQAFHLTRNRQFLIKGVAAILIGFALLAAAAHSWQKANGWLTEAQAPNSGEQILEELHRLQQSQNPQPTRLAAWIRSTAGLLSETDEADLPLFDAERLTLGTTELEPVIRKHTTSEKGFEVFANYTRCRFTLDKSAENTAARDALVQAALEEPPLRYAGEFQGDLLYLESKLDQALASYMRDIQTDDAGYAREMALALALRLSDSHALRTLAAHPRGISETRPEKLIRIYQLLDDKKVLLRALYSIHSQRWTQLVGVPLALMGAVMWYIILVYTGSRERLRWVKYLAPVVLGVVSVMVLHWFQITLAYPGPPVIEDNPTKEMLHWIIYVGVPEESCKLALFALCLPVLLRYGTARKAALTAGCVGLGFALNENLHYFLKDGLQLATSRLLTANFFHIALTGLVGWHLFELFRTRFHHATQFLTVFAGACIAHGLYNFAAGITGGRWEIDIASIIILAVAAKLYLHTLHPDQEYPSSGSGNPISRTCVFWFGSSLLTGALMIVAVWQQRDLAGISSTLKVAIALIPVSFIYLREFDEVH